MVRAALALALAAALAGLSTLGTSAAVPGIPSLYVEYSPDCTFTLIVDPGTPITATSSPGSTIPPGSYDLSTVMSNTTPYQCGKPLLSFSGPGASYQVFFPGAEVHDEHVVTLQPSSTYVVDDENAPATARRVFTTAASGSSASLVVSGSHKTTGSNTQKDIVGSSVAPYRGKLAATVSAIGVSTLTLHGKRITSLKAGQYDIDVIDSDAHAGFFVKRPGHSALIIASVTFTGKHVRRVTLTKGPWTFFSKIGKPTSFAAQ